MDRRYPDRPLVGVGAIIFRGESVLLIQRGREPARGRWSLPGGLVRVGESLEGAVRREVQEEVGLDVAVGDVAAVLDRVFRDGAGGVEYHYVLVDFVCFAASGEPQPADDALDCVFVEPGALKDYELTSGTGETIRRARERLTQGGSPSLYDPAL